MSDPRDLVCFEGEVAPAAGADVVAAEAWLDSGGDAPERTLIRHPFTLISDGTRVEVEVAPDAAVVPARQIAGPWRDIRDHVTRPVSAGHLHDEGHVKLTYGIVAVGDRVCVIGTARDHQFVPDTGGPREPPARRLQRIEAVVIGVGDSARRDAEEQLAREQRAEQRAIDRKLEQDARRARAPERARRRAIAWTWAVRIGRVLLAAAGLAAIVGLGALISSPSGIAHIVATWGVWLAVAACWASAPRRPFPGGAVGSTVSATAGLIASGGLFVALLSIGLPIAGVVGGVNMEDTFAVLNLAGLAVISGGLAVAGAAASVSRPRARPGRQIELPSHTVVRVALVFAMSAACALAIWSIARRSGSAP